MWIDKFVWSKLWRREPGQTDRHTSHVKWTDKSLKTEGPIRSCQIISFTLRLWSLEVQQCCDEHGNYHRFETQHIGNTLEYDNDMIEYIDLCLNCIYSK